eukprot:9298920-Pyramimonas_sp.AAC.1
MDHSDTGSAGIFSRWTNRTQEMRVYSHDGPIGQPIERLDDARRTRSLTGLGNMRRGGSGRAHEG